MTKENDPRDQDGAGDGNDGGDAGSKVVTMTQSELDRHIQSAVDRRVTEAVRERDKRIKALETDKGALETRLTESGQSTEEVLQGLREKNETLARRVQELEEQVASGEQVFGDFYDSQLATLPEAGRERFEKLCPTSLGVRERIALLGKMQAEGIFATPTPAPEGGEGEGEGEGDGKPESGAPAGGDGAPATTPRVPHRDGEGGRSPAGKEGQDRAASRKTRETTDEGGVNLWPSGRQ